MTQFLTPHWRCKGCRALNALGFDWCRKCRRSRWTR
jgi:hypothetical protein